MLRKTITYTDFNGNERTEDFYFNLTKAELTEMEMVTDGGLTNKLQRIVDTNDTKSMIDTFKDIICRSYGVKSEDGKRFVKNDELRNEFVQSEAYSELFMELVTDPEASAAFINGIIPQGLNK